MFFEVVEFLADMLINIGKYCFRRRQWMNKKDVQIGCALSEHFCALTITSHCYVLLTILMLNFFLLFIDSNVKEIDDRNIKYSNIITLMFQVNRILCESCRRRWTHRFCANKSIPIFGFDCRVYLLIPWKVF